MKPRPTGAVFFLRFLRSFAAIPAFFFELCALASLREIFCLRYACCSNHVRINLRAIVSR